MEPIEKSVFLDSISKLKKKGGGGKCLISLNYLENLRKDYSALAYLMKRHFMRIYPGPKKL
jgi:hypothetical protein